MIFRSLTHSHTTTLTHTHMTGYTHNFIVTCPAVTAPRVVTRETYPCAQYYSDMCALGFDLMHIAKRHTRAGEDERV